MPSLQDRRCIASQPRFIVVQKNCRGRSHQAVRRRRALACELRLVIAEDAMNEIERSARRNVGLGLVALGLAAATTARARGRRSYSFNGRSVVITGGSRGLGLVLARQLAAEGAQLTLLARNGR